MAMCEKCWQDAYVREFGEPFKPQVDHYRNLLKERAATPCSPKEQAGCHWDDKLHIDSRLVSDHTKAVP